MVDAGISGSDIRDMMPDAVEKRFGRHHAAHPVVMLSNNGWPYTARATRIFSRPARPVPLLRAGEEPAEHRRPKPFVLTLKRDYVNVPSLPDALSVLDLVGGWIEDYNENHPHLGLKMHPPHAFIAAQK